MRIIEHTRRRLAGPWDNPSPAVADGAGPARAETPVREATRVLGLGDLVEMVAKPIAREIDGATADLWPRYATRLAGCSACSKRRRFLNQVVRNVRSRREWLTAWRRVRPAYRNVWGCSRRVRKAA